MEKTLNIKPTDFEKDSCTAQIALDGLAVILVGDRKELAEKTVEDFLKKYPIRREETTDEV